MKQQQQQILQILRKSLKNPHDGCDGPLFICPAVVECSRCGECMYYLGGMIWSGILRHPPPPPPCTSQLA